MDSEGAALQDRFKVSENSQPCQTDWVAIDAEKRCGQSFSPLTSLLISLHQAFFVIFYRLIIYNFIVKRIWEAMQDSA